jgi:transcriptional regulator with XRE-family HTH domain
MCTLTFANMETSFGERIRELRQARDMSLRELARETEIVPAYLSDIELGKRFPSDEVLRKLAKLLGTTVEDLKSYDTRPPIDEMKRKSYASPTYGFALRRMVEEDVSGEELLKMIERLKQAKRKKER